ncbi:MAG: thiamine pyrophosphate-dependent dehydrogenase E1 component subunit alpha [Bosea sp. (in: a-proteobacteria)]|uniref:thiamine pyrophosphate-dependent dehydrogenase E1 component subunit alpha n=1 Tax=Bosea sp. (in: a-proteobacteria) TaxID=1871050 RepID=UPI002736D456|nr:thiamine pyrophosphate-dependent dehydrogenase E1 component subunit alpha [Bosea sp. (in: a-proteobacteria)]MDP3600551.1 thiamine pyrophosphate-dependent dehydrogenase E1 component subunit alpha [Bosea sp. (in: a-proteobacteria)]
MSKPQTQGEAGTGHNAAAELLVLYRSLLLIRRSEERLSRMFADGEVPGFIHLSIGQEAVSAGVMSALSAEDTIASTHRGHGHAIAKGLSLDGFFAELLARDTGLCRGRGGSMHVADMSVGMLGANGIVGAGLSIALGSALAHKTQKNGAIAVAFFGDGALAEGLIHECLNMAALWKLPLLFVCENNGWGEFLPTSKQLSFTLKDLAAAYRIPHVMIDGNDVAVVAEHAARLVAEVRAEGPRVLECMTTRVRGHFEGDAQKYRDPDELAALSERDPLNVAARQLETLGVSEVTLSDIADEIAARIEAAVESARAAPMPSFEAAMADVYTSANAMQGDA